MGYRDRWEPGMERFERKLNVPPPPVDCTAVVESPARKKAGGFASLTFAGAAGALATKATSVAKVAMLVPNSILKPELFRYLQVNWLEGVKYRGRGLLALSHISR
jgi:hypothetical protein